MLLPKKSIIITTVINLMRCSHGYITFQTYINKGLHDLRSYDCIKDNSMMLL